MGPISLVKQEHQAVVEVFHLGEREAERPQTPRREYACTTLGDVAQLVRATDC